MGLREKLSEKPSVAAVASGRFVLLASIIIARTYWPEKRADLSKALYSDDDGQSWFVDTAYLVPPFEHNGKTAVVAQVYTYNDGRKKFCAYLARFTPQAKHQLEAALAQAKKNNLPPASVSLYGDSGFLKQGQEVKLPGSGNPWIAYSDPKAQPIFTIHSPDGSEVDQYFPE